MEFREDAVAQFELLFEARKSGILASEGCLHVALLRDINQPNIFFTYSHWRDQDALEGYRHSEFFKDTWAKTKVLFAGRAAAWSVEDVSLAG